MDKYTVYMIAHFTECDWTVFSGIRDMNFINGVYNYLEPHFNIVKIDASQIKLKQTKDNRGQVAFSKFSPSIPDGGDVLILQTDFSLINDVAHTKVVYFHIDGLPALTSSGLDFGLRMFVAPGVHSYKVYEQNKILYPFIFMEGLNPNRKKDIVISCIDRDNCSYDKYLDILERSQFTIIDGYHFISKRAYQALACKTIPIIVTNMENMYRILGFKEPFAIFMTHDMKGSVIIPEGYDIEAVKQQGYDFIAKSHSARSRMGQIKRIMNRIYSQPHTR